MSTPYDRDQLSSVLEYSQDITLVIDEDGTISFVSPPVEDIIGYSTDELIGENAFDLIHSEDREDVIERFSSLIETPGDASDRVTHRIYTKNSNVIWVESISSNQTDTALDGYVINIREITARKQRERKLRQVTQAVEATGHAVYITDQEGVIEYVNPAFETITGYTEEEAVGQPLDILNSGQMPESHYENLWATLLAGAVWEEEVVNRRKSGELYNAAQTIAPIQTDGDIEGFVAIQRNTTEERELLDDLKTYRQAIESASELIAAADTEHRYLFANQQYLDYHGLDETAILGKRLPVVLDEETWEEAKSYVKQAVDGESVSYVMKRPSPSGGERFLDIQYYPLRAYDTEDIHGVVATMRDVTDLLERQQQSILLARVLRHNLRNAMNVIRGHAENVHAAGSESSSEDARKIISQSDSLLETAKKTGEITELFLEDHLLVESDVVQRLSTTVEDIKSDRPEIDVTLDIPDSASVVASTKLGRALEELLRNAIIHNDQAQPVIAISVRQLSESVQIEIRDNGPGIPKVEWDVLTVGEEPNPLYHGSGIGLWLVYWTVRRSQGDLKFRDHKSRGSVVILELPRP